MIRIAAYSILFVVLVLFSACEEIGEGEKRKGEVIDIPGLISHPWRISDFTLDNALEGMYLVFEDDFSLRLIDQQGEEITGNWAVSEEGTLLVVRMDTQQPPFDLLDDEWVIQSQNASNLRIVVQLFSNTKEFRCEAVDDGDLPRKNDDDDDDNNDDGGDDDDDDDDDNDDDDDDNNDDGGNDDDDDDDDDDNDDDDDDDG